MNAIYDFFRCCCITSPHRPNKYPLKNCLWLWIDIVQAIVAVCTLLMASFAPIYEVMKLINLLAQAIYLHWRLTAPRCACTVSIYIECSWLDNLFKQYRLDNVFRLCLFLCIVTFWHIYLLPAWILTVHVLLRLHHFRRKKKFT